MMPLMVPKNRHKPFSNKCSRMGCAVAHTVMADHCGCSKPKAWATTMAMKATMAVLKANVRRLRSKPARSNKGKNEGDAENMDREWAKVLMLTF